jgi:hypothetical protein
MDPQADFRELLSAFVSAKVEFLIVGGYALAFHGAPRSTGDLDLLIRPEPDNARRAVEALAASGLGDLGITVEDLIHPERVVQIGVPPVRVVLLTSLSGVTWDEAWAGREKGFYGDLQVPYIGRAELVRNKAAVGRPRDLPDIASLTRGQTAG